MWQNPDRNLALTNCETHVWRAKLNLSTDNIAELTQILSEDERLKANRFRFAHHQRRYIAARGILRKIVSSYLNTDSNLVKFEYNSRGKPKIADFLNQINLQFNVSHSEDLALYGFTRDRRIGIDLEYLKKLDDVAKIAQRFFTATESSLIAALSGDEQKRVFLQFWTAKEAYLKAIGTGLTGGLEQVEISLEPQSTLLISGGNLVENAANWSLQRFNPETDYVATIATETKSQPQQVKFFAWESPT